MAYDSIPGQCLSADVSPLDLARDANVEILRIDSHAPNARPNVGTIALQIPDDAINTIGVMLLRIDNMRRCAETRAIYNVIFANQ